MIATTGVQVRFNGKEKWDGSYMERVAYIYIGTTTFDRRYVGINVVGGGLKTYTREWEDWAAHGRSFDHDVQYKAKFKELVDRYTLKDDAVLIINND